MIVALGLALLAVGSAGCGGPDNDGACDQLHNCIGGNDADYDACVISLERYEDDADLQGCDDEYDVWFECYFANATCTDGGAGQGCSTNADCSNNGGACVNGSCQVKVFSLSDQELCKDERTALQRCQQFGGLPF
jgi:hypothetical protein